MDINQFLQWVASAGGAAGLVSFLAERFPALQKLSSQAKGLTQAGACIVLAIVAYAVMTYIPPDTLKTLAPYFQIVYGVGATWVANQIAHKADPHTG